jgi:hypothetical protein
MLLSDAIALGRVLIEEPSGTSNEAGAGRERKQS